MTQFLAKNALCYYLLLAGVRLYISKKVVKVSLNSAMLYKQ